MNRRSVSGQGQNRWDGSLSATELESQAMSRFPSQDSTGAHSQASALPVASNSYDHTRSAMLQNLSHVSFPTSSASSDVTGRSNSPDSIALYTAPQLDTQTFQGFSFPDTDEFLGDVSNFHRNSTAGISSELIDSSYNNVFTETGEDAYCLHGQGPITADSLLFDPSSGNVSPTLWDSNVNFLESGGSSPNFVEEAWTLPSAEVLVSTNSPIGYSSSLGDVTPTMYAQDYAEMSELPSHSNSTRPSKKPIGPRQSKVNSDIARNPHVSDNSDEALKYTGRNVDTENNARVHPLYQNAAPKSDGLYHCPWEGQDSCQHRPEKLKCNYDKFVDSHLKPYRCKVFQCENLQFSSTACLLRHEREAHAMHGHGEKPFPCTYEGCDRGVHGNGFPRHWNLRDHMRRVHNDPGPPKSSASGSPPPTTNVRGKKRKVAERPESPGLRKSDKAVKRAVTPVPEPKEPTPLERYQQSQHRLQEIVHKLEDPTAPECVALFREASTCFQVMQKTAQVINKPNRNLNY